MAQFEIACFTAINADRKKRVPGFVKDEEQKASLFTQKDVSKLSFDSQSLGGAGVNVGVGHTYLGATAYIIGKVGTDSSGKFLLDEMLARGVKFIGPFPPREGVSGIAYIREGEGGGRSIEINPGENDNTTLADVAPKLPLIKKCRGLHNSSFALAFTDASFETQLKLTEEYKKEAKGANGKSGTTFLAPGELYSRDLRNRRPQDYDKLLGLTDYLLLTEKELWFQTGQAMDVAAPAVISKYGMQAVVVTRGKLGARIFGRQGKKYDIAPPKPARITNEVGAGDAFHAGVEYAILRGKNLEEAGNLGTKMAGFCLEGRSATEYSLPVYMQYI